MAEFIELPSGRFVNLDNIRAFNPNRSDRLDYIVGGYELLADSKDVAALTTALRAKLTPKKALPKRSSGAKEKGLAPTK